MRKNKKNHHNPQVGKFLFSVPKKMIVFQVFLMVTTLLLMDIPFQNFMLKRKINDFLKGLSPEERQELENRLDRNHCGNKTKRNKVFLLKFAAFAFITVILSYTWRSSRNFVLVSLFTNAIFLAMLFTQYKIALYPF